jgi:hypothetical protein
VRLEYRYPQMPERRIRGLQMPPERRNVLADQLPRRFLRLRYQLVGGVLPPLHRRRQVGESNRVPVQRQEHRSDLFLRRPAKSLRHAQRDRRAPVQGRCAYRCGTSRRARSPASPREARPRQRDRRLPTGCGTRSARRARLGRPRARSRLDPDLGIQRREPATDPAGHLNRGRSRCRTRNPFARRRANRGVLRRLTSRGARRRGRNAASGGSSDPRRTARGPRRRASGGDPGRRQGGNTAHGTRRLPGRYGNRANPGGRAGLRRSGGFPGCASRRRRARRSAAERRACRATRRSRKRRYARLRASGRGSRRPSGSARRGAESSRRAAEGRSGRFSCPGCGGSRPWGRSA